MRAARSSSRSGSTEVPPAAGRSPPATARGRSCPRAHRYQPEALARPAQLSADTVFVVGGLYGNLAALRAVLERADREPDGPATVVFNGDFHWLDVEPDSFRAVSETVLAHHAIKGNFAGTTDGVITRLSSSLRPPGDSLYGATVGALRFDAVPVGFEVHRWKERFLAQWPPGSPGHRSYLARLTGGTQLRLHQAARAGVRLTGAPRAE